MLLLRRGCAGLAKKLASLKYKELQYFYAAVRADQLADKLPSEVLIRKAEGVDSRNYFLQE